MAPSFALSSLIRYDVKTSMEERPLNHMVGAPTTKNMDHMQEQLAKCMAGVAQKQNNGLAGNTGASRLPSKTPTLTSRPGASSPQTQGSLNSNRCVPKSPTTPSKKNYFALLRCKTKPSRLTIFRNPRRKSESPSWYLASTSNTSLSSTNDTLGRQIRPP